MLERRQVDRVGEESTRTRWIEVLTPVRIAQAGERRVSGHVLHCGSVAAHAQLSTMHVRDNRNINIKLNH